MSIRQGRQMTSKDTVVCKCSPYKMWVFLFFKVACIRKIHSIMNKLDI